MVVDVDPLPELRVYPPDGDPFPDLVEGQRLSRSTVPRSHRREFFLWIRCFLLQALKENVCRDIGAFPVGVPEPEHVNVVPGPRGPVGVVTDDHGCNQGERLKIRLEDPSRSPVVKDKLSIPLVG